MARKAGDGTGARHWRPALAFCLALGLAACEDRDGARPVIVDIVGQPGELADPLRHDESAAGQAVLGATAQGLVAFDPHGDVVAALAESWIVADGGQSYIFRLRRTHWANGEAIKADTVARLLQQRMRASPDLMAGLRPEVRAMTDRVIEIRLDTALPAFIQLLAQPRLGLIGKDGGAGPYVGEARIGRLHLQPMRPPDEETPDGETPEVRPIDRRTLQAGRASLAVVRYQDGKTDIMLGGRFQDLLLIPHARLGTTDVRADPAPGLFGLAIVGNSDFLADHGVREALSRAIDRPGLAAALNLQGWTTATTPLPAMLDMSREPTAPPWAGQTAQDRLAEARRAVAAWRAAHGEPPALRIALPAGAGATLLFHRLAADLRALDLRIVRVGHMAAADLRLIDEVAGFDSALWYLARLDCTGKIACDEEASAFLDKARSAASPIEQATLLAEAERRIVAHGGYIPLGMPIRWSLVSGRLTGYAPSPRGIHPLNGLIRNPN